MWLIGYYYWMNFQECQKQKTRSNIKFDAGQTSSRLCFASLVPPMTGRKYSQVCLLESIQRKTTKRIQGLCAISYKVKAVKFGFLKEMYVKRGPDRSFQVERYRGSQAKLLGSITQIELATTGSNSKRIALRKRQEEIAFQMEWREFSNQILRSFTR